MDRVHVWRLSYYKQWQPLLALKRFFFYANNLLRCASKTLKFNVKKYYQNNLFTTSKTRSLSWATIAIFHGRVLRVINAQFLEKVSHDLWISYGSIKLRCAIFRPIFGRAIYFTLWCAWMQTIHRMTTVINSISSKCWKSNAGGTNIEREWHFQRKKDILMQSTNARPIEELTTKTDDFFEALTFSDKYKTVNTQIRAVFLGFFCAWDRKTRHLPWGFPVVGFLLTPSHLFTWVQRQSLPNIFVCVWEKSAEACTSKNREISNMRRLYCLEALAARQTLYKQAFRRKNVLHGYKRKLSGKHFHRAQRENRKAAVNRQD